MSTDQQSEEHRRLALRREVAALAACLSQLAEALHRDTEISTINTAQTESIASHNNEGCDDNGEDGESAVPELSPASSVVSSSLEAGAGDGAAPPPPVASEASRPLELQQQDDDGDKEGSGGPAPRHPLEKPMRTFLWLAAATAHKGATCDRHTAALVALRSRSKLTCGGNSKSATTTDGAGAGDDTAELVRRVRRLDTENDSLRAQVDALRERLRRRAVTARKSSSSGGEVTAPATTIAIAIVDGTAHAQEEEAVAAYRRGIAEEKRRAPRLAGELELAAARHRGRLAARAYCAAAEH